MNSIFSCCYVDAPSNTLSRGVLQSAANFLIIMLAGGKHTYTNRCRRREWNAGEDPTFTALLQAFRNVKLHAVPPP